jgi:hypothetical protein
MEIPKRPNSTEANGKVQYFLKQWNFVDVKRYNSDPEYRKSLSHNYRRGWRLGPMKKIR